MALISLLGGLFIVQQYHNLTLVVLSLLIIHLTLPIYTIDKGVKLTQERGLYDMIKHIVAR